jgi:hypothetical protein
MDALRQQLSECERQLEQEVEISTRSREEAAVALARSGVRLLHSLRAQRGVRCLDALLPLTTPPYRTR